MKIQVSFDRTAKKEFRDVCIQRLKNFVEQIKYNETSKNKPTPCIQLNENQSFNRQQAQRSKLNELTANRISQSSNEAVRESKTLRKQAKGCIQSSKTAVKKSESLTKQNEDESNGGKSRLSVNMREIKENLSKIMQKFQKQHVDHYENNKKLEEKLSNTNQKIDLLIDQLRKKRVIQSPQDNSQEQMENEQTQEQFEQKFKELQSKFNRIKQNSLNNSSSRFNPSKSIYSMQQTNDSLTFRRNY